MFARAPRRPAPFLTAHVRVLEALESRVTPAGLTYTTTTSTIVTEVVTNTPTTIELFDTRVVVPEGSAALQPPVFDRLIPAAYDPANPDIIAASHCGCPGAVPGRTINDYPQFADEYR